MASSVAMSRSGPPGIFRRSFIRAYAAAIGLDPDTVCRKFEEQFPDPADTTRQAPAAAVRSSAAIPAIMSASDEGSHLGFRLTLEETTGLFRGGQLLTRGNRRLKAVAWDAGTLFAIALSAFIVLESLLDAARAGDIGGTAWGASSFWGTRQASLCLPRGQKTAGTASHLRLVKEAIGLSRSRSSRRCTRSTSCQQTS